ncbi:rhotekin isoform X1 [Salmo salar]|uniref:Rhotekin isoform X1 n=1 Tax=Salmo salar TaxID=8030 RepID=A0A1S3KYU1_SALSA|nr:rhotekin isoform X1 [Salmo salar]|eukprot:XP_013983862.1 PREDICTED: rhotekin-like isoform X1 [Salmo salar]
MFCRHQVSRTTIARGSALDLEIRRRGHFNTLTDTAQDGEVQRQIDREVRMREGASKLLAACSQRDQALEASKSLLTCNTRILALLSQLQRMREAQVLQRVGHRSCIGGSLDERLPCMGNVAISDLRIPLMWKDSEYFKSKGELHRCAVFCLLQCGREIYDTDLVMADRTLTDICFEDTVIFKEASPCFEIRVELYSTCVVEDFCPGPGALGPRRHNRLSSSLGCTSGRRIRAALESAACGTISNVEGGDGRGGSPPPLLPALCTEGPKYHLLAHTTLTIAHVQDSFRTHDLSISATEDSAFWLPLYGSVCCRLVAQPLCMTQQVISGRIKLEKEPECWTDIYGVLKGTSLICYHSQESMVAQEEPLFTIAINKETRIHVSERGPLHPTQSISINTHTRGEEAVTHTLVTHTPQDTQLWMEAFRQHFYDMSQWKQCCNDLLKIEVPSPRKSHLVTAKQGSLYHEMVTPSSPGESVVIQDNSVTAEVWACSPLTVTTVEGPSMIARLSQSRGPTSGNCIIQDRIHLLPNSSTPPPPNCTPALGSDVQ